MPTKQTGGNVILYGPILMESLPPGNEVVGGQNRPSRQAEPDEPQGAAHWSNMVSGTFESCCGINNRIVRMCCKD
jgi:hypothetical protein